MFGWFFSVKVNLMLESRKIKINKISKKNKKFGLLTRKWTIEVYLSTEWRFGILLKFHSRSSCQWKWVVGKASIVTKSAFRHHHDHDYNYDKVYISIRQTFDASNFELRLLPSVYVRFATVRLKTWCLCFRRQHSLHLFHH